MQQELFINKDPLSPGPLSPRPKEKVGRLAESEAMMGVGGDDWGSHLPLNSQIQSS